jgi:hypothetical protein
MVPLDEAAARVKGWSAEDLAFLRGLGCSSVAKGKGCDACFGSGFFGS